MIFKEDSFYEHEPSSQIVCGECVKEDLWNIAIGKYTGDEVMHESEFRYLLDQDDEPYQCNNCNKQNDAYETIDDE